MLASSVALLFCLLPVTEPHGLDEKVPATTATAFPEGNLEDIAVKIGKATPVTNGANACLVEITVSNGGELPVEPLSIAFASKDAIELRSATRAELPFYGRIGRPVPPRGKATYTLFVPLDQKSLKSGSAAIESASFLGDPELVEWAAALLDSSAPPVSVGKPTRHKAFSQEFGKTVERTTIPLENHLDRPIDVQLRATYTNPKKGETLLLARVEASGTHDLVVGELTVGANEWWPGAEISKVELSDWCIVVDPGKDKARSLLEAALDSRYRRPAQTLPLGADFVFEVDATTYDGKDYSERTRGRIVIERDGTANFSTQENLSGSAKSDLQDLVDELAEALLPPTAKDVLEVTKVSMVAGGAHPWILIEPNPFTETNLPAYVQLKDGRIAVVGTEPSWSGLPWNWETRAFGDAWILTGREEEHYNGDFEPEVVLSVDYLTGNWGCIPTTLTRSWDDHLVGAKGESSLSLDGWRGGVESLVTPKGPPPTGALAEELKAAWEGFYRNPELAAQEADATDHPRFVLTGQLRIESPANDDLWEGHESLRGTFRLAKPQGTFWRDAEVEIDERRLTLVERERLAGVVSDRLLMWSGRDVTRQPSFDVAFAGTRLAEDDGWIRVIQAEEGTGAIDAVKLSGGKVRAIRFGSGLMTEYAWEKLGSTLVPTLQTTGRETLRITWKKVKGDWLFPSEVVFRDVFSTKDYSWGPETLTLSKLKLEQEG